MSNKPILTFIVIVSFVSCLDKFEFTSAEPDSILVVDGRITDHLGPYTVKLTQTQKVENLFLSRSVSAKSVEIIDNVGVSEFLAETEPGIYQTNPAGIKGVVGNDYKVRIETRDGKIYESIPEKILPAGGVDSIYFNFQTVNTEAGNINYQFKINIDSHGESQSTNYFLWKLTGTYRVVTSPELHIILGAKPEEPPPPPKKDPRPCSGYIYDLRVDKLVYIRPCECCECWADLVSKKPYVSDITMVDGGNFKQVEVGVIPVEFWPFWDKTMVKVEQMSLSKSAYEFWKSIKDQKEGAGSLFQPAIGNIPTNLIVKKGRGQVYGFFQASSVSKRIRFLTTNHIPLGAGVIPPPPPIPPRYVPTGDFVFEEFISDPFVVREACIGAFANSTTKKPVEWQ